MHIYRLAMLLVLPGLASGAAKETNPFGIKVRKSVLSLVREIESTYRHALIEGSLPEGADLGESGITNEGYPFVLLSVKGHTESTLVHELMHLRLHARGFASIAWTFPPGQNTGPNRKYIKWLMGTVKDTLEHWIFYPEIRKLGIDPDLQARKGFRELVRTGAFEGLQPETQHVGLAIYYFQAQLLQESNLAKRVNSTYLRNGWKKEAQIGGAMARKVLSHRPVTPESQINDFVDCLNKLHAGSLAFAILRWGRRPRGTFSERFVEIAVSPLTSQN